MVVERHMPVFFVGERAIYFGGHDPNGFVSTDMAWIYKRTLPKQGR